jgi:hypothetical protein
MTLVSLPRGLIFPQLEGPAGITVGASLDAATEKFAMIGHLYLDGRPSSKTFSTGSIQFRLGTATWAAVGPASTAVIGIQGVSTSGPVARPDGTFVVSKTLTSPVGLTQLAWNTVSMDTGSMSLSNGDLIAVVWDMTARNGSDTFQIYVGHVPFTSGLVGHMPVTNTFFSGTWQTNTSGGTQRWPNVVLTMDDGTIGCIMPTVPFFIIANELFHKDTDPDEVGLVFQLPFDCTVDALWSICGFTDANSDFNIKLYSNPTSDPPTELAAVSHLAERMGPSSTETFFMRSITPINLSKNTPYLVTIEATGTGTARVYSCTLGHTDHRALYSCGTTLNKATRQNASGPFTLESPAITLYRMGVMISHVEDGSGGGAEIVPPTYVVGL